MAQDLRDLFREERKKVQRPDMLKGHAQRFENLLEQRLPKEEKSAKQHKFFFMKIAAVLVVAVSIGWFLYQSGRSSVENAVVNTQQSTENQVEKETNRYLSDISPEYKQIEDYYLASINAELSQLTVTTENKELIDSFMNQLAQLDKEYQRLNAEIEENGIDEQTVSILINNLELRLELLYKLKDKLKQMKKDSLQEMQGAQA